MIRYYRSTGGHEWLAIDHSSAFTSTYEGQPVTNYRRVRVATNQGIGFPEAIKTVIGSASVADGLIEVSRGDVPAAWLEWLDRW